MPAVTNRCDFSRMTSLARKSQKDLKVAAPSPGSSGFRWLSNRPDRFTYFKVFSMFFITGISRQTVIRYP
jgi:hypothetical protein